jgi:hypothetical protein
MIDTRYFLLFQSFLNSRKEYLALSEELKEALKIEFNVKGEQLQYTYPSEEIRILTADIMNVFEKLGFVVYHDELIKELSQKKPRTKNEEVSKVCEIKILLFDYICNTKAFLDSVAYLLNNKYSLGLRGNEISLDKERFRASLEKKDPSMADLIREHTEWIEEVTRWRMNLIHKFTNVIYSDNESTCMVVDDPDYKSLDFLVKGLTEEISKKNRNVVDLCSYWNKNSEKMAKSLFKCLLVEYPP